MFASVHEQRTEYRSIIFGNVNSKVWILNNGNNRRAWFKDKRADTCLKLPERHSQKLSKQGIAILPGAPPGTKPDSLVPKTSALLRGPCPHNTRARPRSRVKSNWKSLLEHNTQMAPTCALPYPCAASQCIWTAHWLLQVSYFHLHCQTLTNNCVEAGTAQHPGSRCPLHLTATSPDLQVTNVNRSPSPKLTTPAVQTEQRRVPCIWQRDARTTSHIFLWGASPFKATQSANNLRM